MNATIASAQVALPFFPAPTLPGADTLGRRAGVEYLDLPVKEILNRADSPRFGFTWSINPYRGCEFGCTYCYARSTHGFLDFADPMDFENRIFVKQRAAESLRRALARRDLHGQAIAIGTATDPYQPAEKRFRITRSILEAFLETEGLALSITTKSPLILSDLDLLEELDRKHALSIHLTITTADAGLARRLETNAPDPAARLRTVAALAERGLAVKVFAMPILPGLNDAEEELLPLLTQVREAGAYDVAAQALYLKPASRARFFPWLAAEFPELAGLYRRLFRDSDYLSESAKDELLATFRRLRLELGFPRALASRA